MSGQIKASIHTVGNRNSRPYLAFPLAFAFAVAFLTLIPSVALAAGSAVTNPATKVHHTTVVLNGHLDPEGDPGITDCQFEWGETFAYGNTAPCAEGSAFGAPAEVSALLTGLTPAETYHFRLRIETTSNGLLTGIDQSFRTIPVPTEHSLVTSFGEDGTSGSSFSGTFATPAMNQTTKRLYVADGNVSAPNVNARVHGFDVSIPSPFLPLGGFPVEMPPNIIDQFIPIAVDNTGLSSAGNVYYASGTHDADTRQLNGINSSGTKLPGFPIKPAVNPGPPVEKNGQVGSIAVNSTGEIWAAVSGNGNPYRRIIKYNSAGVFQGSFDVPIPGDTPHRIAFDSEDNLYVAVWLGFSTALWKVSAASNYTSAVKLHEPPVSIWSLAYDPVSDYMYAAAYSSTVFIYDVPSGILVDEFDTGEQLRGIAVDPTDHTVYLGSSQKVNVYGTGADLFVPTATTGVASAVTGTKATLEGFVDPEGQPITECKFEYGLGTSYANTAPCTTDPGSGSGDVAVSAEVTGLTPNTTYRYRVVAANSAGAGKGQDKTFTTNSPPLLISPEAANVTYNSTELKAQLNPKGFQTNYHFEYGATTAYGTTVPVPDGNAGSATSEVAINANLSGLSPDTLYHWRVVAENVNGQVTTSDQTFTTFGPVKVETTGSPLRTATTAQLQGRVNPDGAATTYRFEYGTEGSCDTNPCTTTSERSAGSGGVYKFVTEQIEGLEPDTTYHYRLIAESPTPGGPAVGEGMTVTTRASDAPLSHGRFPGPPGSDRAYEQVSLPDTGGNPVGWALAVSDDGNRAFYQVFGGTPISVTGTYGSMLYAERTPSGWHSEDTSPPRDQLVGALWFEPAGRSDLSDQISMNINSTDSSKALWRMQPGQPPAEVFVFPPNSDAESSAIVSEDASRVLVRTDGSHDPAHPTPPNFNNLYDVSSGPPQLVSLLPDGSVSSCDVKVGGVGTEVMGRPSHLVSPDGSLVFFETCGDVFVRDLDAGETKLIGSGSLIKWTPNGVFFHTAQSLVPADAGGNDIYRYDIDDESRDCVTCVTADVNTNLASGGTVVAPDGSRVYFASTTALRPGATTPGTYRVSVETGALAYVAPGSSFSEEGNGAISPNGDTVMFTSKNEGLNAIGGQQNGDTQQYYRYDDDDRSLVCLSCPQDGSAPQSGVSQELVANDKGVGANRTVLSADGKTVAFTTPTALISADQNTARAGQSSSVGTDVYEWRDGRLLLISDGLTEWPDGGPLISAITPSGDNIFFTAATQYTVDALDGYRRLYTARIGGGIEFPSPPKPCPLEVCQGTPQGAPEEQEPGSGNFSGSGNKASTPGRRPCPRGRHKARKGGKTRCVKSQGKGKAQQKRSQRAKNDRRIAR